MSESLSESLPQISKSPDGLWRFDWDRSLEAGEISEFISRDETHGGVALVEGADGISSRKIASIVSSSTGRSPIAFGIGSKSDDFICAVVISEFMRRTRRVPPNVISEVMKSTSGSTAYSLANNYALRSISNLIHRQRRAGAPITLRNAIAANGIVADFDSSLLDVAYDNSYASRKQSSGSLAKLLAMDIAGSSILQDFLKKQLFVVYDSYPSADNYWVNFTNRLDYLKILFFSYRSMYAQSIKVNNISNRVCRISIPSMSLGEAKEILVAPTAGLFPGFRGELLDKTIEDSGSRGYFNGKYDVYYSEQNINRILSALYKLTEEGFGAENLQPQVAPVDASVIDGVLTLSGQGTVNTNTPIEQLEALREAYLEDIQRLQGQLKGSNAGDSFSARLEAVGRRLSIPLTESNSIVLATQVRALEDMLPAVKELLGEVTIADLGATVGGLGLMMRQFPTWRAFLAESDTALPIEGEVLGDLLAATDNIIATTRPEVQVELKQNLSEVRSAATSVSDPALQEGLSRSTNNTYRAIGRFLSERARGVGKEYGAQMDKVLASGLTTATFGALLLAASGPLTRLAAAMPNDYGWLLGVVLWLSAQAKVEKDKSD